MADEKIWKPLELVKVSADYLSTKQVPNPRLDAELLLCDIMGLKRRVDLYAGFEREVSGKELSSYRELIRRRAAREPVSRILGRREFMGLTFAVTPDVLSPRPETELLVETAIEAVRPKKPEPELSADEPVEQSAAEAETEQPEMMPEELERLLDSYGEDADDPDADDKASAAAPARTRSAASSPAAKKAAPNGRKNREPAMRGPALRALDLGTGSGCIAIALAAMLPEARVTAVDASPGALAVAKENAKKAGVAERIEFRRGDWFAACRDGEKFDVALSNPPYLVKGDDGIWPEVGLYDPPMALYGGQDGLDCYRRIIPDLAEWLVPGGLALFEVGAGQAGKVADLLAGNGFESVGAIKDYAGIERVVKGRRA